jgi:tetratricopeptide (TPR) repeat protein
MSTLPPNDTFEFAEHSPQNEAALAELTSAIAFGQGADTITLLLVRCNYGALRERMVAALVARLAAEALDGPVHTLRLAPQDSNLYAQVRAVAAEQRPGAVLVLGTEGVDALDVLLVEMNKRREEFRRDFPFPLVLWFTDDGYRQLSNYANDFESIAGGETIEFRLGGAVLTQQLEAAAQRLFEALLAPDRSESFNRRLIGLDLGCLRPEEVAIALADLQAQGTALPPDLQASVAFARGLNIRNEDAIALFDQSAAHWIGEAGEAAALKRGLALFYLGRARYFVADSEKYQTPDWLPAVAPLETALEIFEQAQRPDLMAQGMIPLARVLHRLERWDDLEAVIQRAIPLHESHSGPDKLAQDYGFLADVALSRQHWPQAATLAQQALDRVAPDSWWRILYLKMLAQAVQAQGHLDAATEHLQAAQALGVREHPKLHSDVLALLQQCLRDQGRYLEAFEVKRERLAVEQQYGLRAFIGAGRLRSRRTEQRATVQSQRRSTEAVAPEIAASGRQRDLDELLKRIAGKEHKLIVLHGASGVGKSSLVNGGLLPALQGRALDNRDNIPVLLRQYTDWARELAQRLTAAVEIQNAKFKGQNSEGGSQESGARSQESGARSQESGARSQESGARSQEPSSPTHPPFDFAQGRPAYPSTHTLLSTLRECEDYTLRPVLIFDQFEEFFFANPDPVDRRVFFEFVVACLELQPSALKIVLSLREDYIHYLLEARQAVRRSALPPGSMARSQLEDILGKQILYGIANFSPEDATAIIESLTAGSRLYLEPVLVAALVADLAGPLQEVRPIEMQIVGAQLQTEGIQTLAQYRRLGDEPKETLVQRYLQDVVEDCGEEHRQLAELVLFLLTDERGTRPLKTRPELVRDLEALGIDWQFATAVPPFSRGEGGISATASLAGESVEDSGRSGSPPSPPLTKGGTGPIDALDLVLKILGGSGIAVQLPDSPDDRYQLVHDYLAGVIRDRQAPQLEALVAELEQKKQKRQEAEAGLAELTAATAAARVEQVELTRKNQQARRFLTGTVAVSALMVAGAMATATWAGRDAREAQREANQVRVEAQQQQTAAEYEVSKADFQVGTATLREGVAQRRSEAAVQQEEDAQAKVEEAETRLAEIDQQAKAELDAAQAAVQSAQDQVAQAEAQQAQAKTDLAAAETAKDTALALQRRAREGTRLERAGVAASQRFAFQETEGLLAALRAVSDLRGLNQEFGITALADYPTASPLLALQTGLDKIRETRFTGHQGRVLQVAFSPNGDQIATSGEDGTGRLWDLGGNQLAVLEGHQGSVLQVAFSPNGDQIATSGADGTTRLWDLGGNQLAVLEGHQGSVLQVAFSPNGDQIATSGEDGTGRLWDLGGNQLVVLEGHQGRVLQVAFSPNGDQIATSGADGTTRLWIVPQVQNGQQLAKPPQVISAQQIAQYEGDGTLREDWRYVATILQPRSPIRDHAVVKLWPISDIDQLITRACTRLAPYLTNNPDVSDADRALCNLPPLTP